MLTTSTIGGRSWRACRITIVVALTVGASLLGGVTPAAAEGSCIAAGVSPYDEPVLTHDGSTVVFTTNAALVEDDTNRTLDVYAQDISSGLVRLVSATAAGEAADARSSTPSISADGRHVAFQSDSTDLVADDDPDGVTDVFVRDLVDATTELISVAPDGAPGAGASTHPSISPDGMLVAFESFAPDLVPGDTNALTDVFVRDRSNGTTRRASVATDGTEADGLGSFAPSISGDGKVAFHSTASTWITPGSDARSFVRDGVYFARNVYVHDLDTATTTHVSVTTDGSPPDGLSLFPAISEDGTRVAFLSSSTNLVDDDTNNRPDLKGFTQADVFVRDLVAETTVRASLGDGGVEADGLGSSGVRINAEGDRVAFESSATNLVDGDTNGAIDVFVHDLGDQQTVRASTTPAGEDSGSLGPLAFGSVSSSLHSDGDTVAFVSSAPGLIEQDDDGSTVFGVFVRSLADGSLIGPLGIGCSAGPSGEALPASLDLEPADRGSGGSAAVRTAPGVEPPQAPAAATNTSTSAVPFFFIAAVAGFALLRHRRIGVVLVVLALGATSLGGVPAEAHHHAPLQPGAPVLRDTGFGTASLNFVFRDRVTDELFIGTAAHAVRESSVGQRIANDDLGEFGTLVYAREGVFSFSTQDFALIRIDADKADLVSPAVRHWGGPTGVAHLDDLLPGLPTYQYGQGAYFRTSEPTRLKPGVISSVLADDWGYVGWVAEVRHGFGGDSGSPILSGPDGEALAVTILFAVALFGEPGVQLGPSIELILQELRLTGFDVELVTAPFHGPAGDAAALAEHCAQRPIEEDVLNEGCVRPGSDL